MKINLEKLIPYAFSCLGIDSETHTYRDKDGIGPPPNDGRSYDEHSMAIDRAFLKLYFHEGDLVAAKIVTELDPNG